MTLRLVKSARELAADEARARLNRAINNMGLSKGQEMRLNSLIADYGVRQFEAGYARGEQVERPKGAA